MSLTPLYISVIFFIIMFLHNVQTVQGSASLNFKANNLKDIEDLLVRRTLISIEIFFSSSGCENNVQTQ